MIYLLLAILSSSLVSIIMRLSSDKVSGKLSMLAVNYLTCLIVAAAFTGLGNLFPRDAALVKTLGMGAVNGVFYLAAFILFQWNVGRNGVVLPSIFMKLGLLVPIAVSIVAFREFPTLVQGTGFCIAVAAIVLINMKKDVRVKGSALALAALLLVSGMAETMSKLYEELGSSALSEQFLLYTFLAAFIICVCLVAVRKERPGKNEIIFGFLIGIPNYFSARFLLWALSQLDAVVVYPTNNVATILLVTLTGVVVFKERLQKRQWIALAAILAALVMLNI